MEGMMGYDDEVGYMVESGSLVIGDGVSIEQNVSFIIINEGDKIIIGNNSVLKSGCVIYGGCEFGNDVLIGHNTVLMKNTIVGNNTYIGALVNCEGYTKIGSHCGINAQSHLTKFTEIDDYVFFGPMVCTTNDWEIRYKRKGHGIDLVGPKIGRGVRVGNMATILPGIILGKNCMIGAGSIVTKNIGENAIAFGVPANVRGIVPEIDRL